MSSWPHALFPDRSYCIYFQMNLLIEAVSPVVLTYSPEGLLMFGILSHTYRYKVTSWSHNLLISHTVFNFFVGDGMKGHPIACEPQKYFRWSLLFLHFWFQFYPFALQGLKIDDRQTRWDYIHDENLRLGENKYSTLQKVSNEFVCHIYFWAFQLNDPSPSRIIKIRYLMLFFVFSFCFLLITSSLVVVHSQILPFCFQLVEHRPRINAAGGSN